MSDEQQAKEPEPQAAMPSNAQSPEAPVEDLDVPEGEKDAVKGGFYDWIKA